MVVRTDIEPVRLDLQFASPDSRRSLVVGLVAGLVAGLVFGLVFGPVFGLVVGPAVGLVVDSFSVAKHPTSVMYQNMVFGLVFGLVVGPVVGLAFGLASGLVSGLVSGLAVWVRYVIGCWLARRQGMLPRRVGQFVDWAYSASLLRMSGTAIQFRHRELQTWLVRCP